MTQPIQGSARVRVEADTSRVVPQVLAAFQQAVQAAQQLVADSGLNLTIEADPSLALDAVGEVEGAVGGLTDQATEVALDADPAPLVEAVGEAEGALSGLREVAAQVGQTLTAGLGVATATIAGLGVATITAGISFNSLSQQVTGALSAVLQSRDAANSLIAEIIELNQTAAFSRQAFLDAGRQLVGFGVAADQVVPTLDAIQQATVALGGGEEEFTRIAEAMARVQSEGQLTQGTLGILRRMGLDVITVIADATGQPFAAVQEQLEAGQIGLEDITSALNTRFAGAVEGYGDTWEGAIGLVLAGLRNIGSALVEPFIGLETGGLGVDVLRAVADVLFELQEQAGPLADVIGSRLEPAVDRITTGLAGLAETVSDLDIDTLIDTVTAGTPLFAAFGAAAAAAGSSAALSAVGLGRLAGVLNPVAAAVTAVVAASPELRGVLVDLTAAAAPLVPVVVDLAAAVGPLLSVSLAALAAALTPVVALVDVVVSAFTALPGPVQTAGVALAGVVLLAPRIAAFGATLTALPGQVAASVTSLRALTVSLAGVRTALGGVLGVLGGPWGLAITAAVTAVSLFGSAQAEAHQVTADFTSTLDRQSGAFTSATRAMVAHELEQRGALQSAQELGIALDDLVGFVLRDEEAHRRVFDAVQQSTEGLDVNSAAYREQTAALADTLRVAEPLRAEVDESAASLSRETEALGGAAGAQGRFAGAVGEATAAMRAQADELLAQVDPIFALNQALQAVEQAQGDFNTAVAEHGPNSAEAQEAALALTEAALRMQGAVGDAAGTFTGRLDPALRDTLRALGLTDEQLAIIEDAFAAAADAGDDFARDRVATVELRGQEEAQARIERLQEALDNIERTVLISFQVEGFRPVGGIAVPNQQGGIYDRPVLSTLAEDSRPEVVLPLTRPDRMTQLITSPVVQQPLVAALGRTLRQVNRTHRDTVLDQLLAGLDEPAQARLTATVLTSGISSTPDTGTDPELLAELKGLRDDIKAMRTSLAAARPVNVTQAPGEDGEALARRVVNRMTLAGVTG